MSKRLNYSREGYLHENFRYFHLKDTAGQELDFHFHEFDKLVVLIQGSVDYMIEGASYRLQPYDILLVRHHMIHKALIDVSVPYERIIIYLDASYVDRFAPNGGLMDCFARAESSGYCLIRPEEEEREEIKKALRQLEGMLDDTAFGAELLRGTSLAQLLVQLNRMQQRSTDTGSATVEYSEKIVGTLSYIHEHLTDTLTIDELAARCYLSRYHFMRLFKSQTGCTVHNYIRQKRLGLAARLIREGMGAAEAASESGFSDYSAFHRAFVRTFGVTPGKMKNV